MSEIEVKNLTKEEVCIIDDKKTKMEVDCITAISLPILLNILQENLPEPTKIDYENL